MPNQALQLVQKTEGMWSRRGNMPPQERIKFARIILTYPTNQGIPMQVTLNVAHRASVCPQFRQTNAHGLLRAKGRSPFCFGIWKHNFCARGCFS